MKEELIVVMDFGTSKVSASLVDLLSGVLKQTFSANYKWLHSQDNFTEINPGEIWHDSQKVIFQLIKNCEDSTLKKIIGMTFSFFGDNVIPIDKNGDYLYDLIPAFDFRSMNEIDEIKKYIVELDFIKITGGKLVPMCVGTKILWLKNNLNSIFRNTKYFYDIQQYILTKLGFNAYNDYTMASRKMLFDIGKWKWSEELLNILGISKESMGYEVLEGKQVIGKIDHFGEVKLPKKIPVVLGAHDTDCGIIGLGAISNENFIIGDILGTFDCIGSMSKKLVPANKILDGSIINYCAPEKDYYISLGAVMTAGALLEWFTSEFCDKSKSKSKLYKDLDSKVNFDGRNNLMVLPDYHSYEGCIFGLNLSNTKSDIYQALMEGITYESKSIVNSLENIFEAEPHSLRMGGGGSKSPKWLQLKADILQRKIEKPKIVEASTLGAAIIGSVGLKYYRDIHEAVDKLVKIDFNYELVENVSSKYQQNYSNYKKLKKSISGFSQNK